jgi:hypothetical protein
MDSNHNTANADCNRNFGYHCPIPIFNLTPQQARQQPSPADAVMRVMRNLNIPVPPMKVDTMGRDIPVMGGQGLCHKQPF